MQTKRTPYSESARPFFPFSESFFTKTLLKVQRASILLVVIGLAENKVEEETYSVIFTSLKHPVRRRILRMLAEKPLQFSEMQESLAIDSGHLNYHLENLGELIVHFNDGKYGLSSIGVAAVKLMSGVEEHQPQIRHEKLKLTKIVSAVYPFILVGALLIASIFALNYTVLSTGALATEPSSSSEIHAATIFIGVNQTIRFNVTTERVPWTGSYNIKIDDQPLVYSDVVEPDGSTLTVGNGFDAPINAITLNKGEIQKVYLGLNITSGDSGFIGSGLPGNFTISYPTPILPITVQGPNGESSELIPQWKTDYRQTEYFIPTGIDVTTSGTYLFEISYGSQGGIATWNGYLTLNASWQSLERPYFYYGLAGLIVSLGYVTFVTVELLQKRKTKHQKPENA
jgi:DNA-binding transcriptional ArsR family regulator